MTVAVVVKVFDGLVVATDSATTFQLQNGSAQVYNNANKIFHLHRRLPIAAMTWGLGNIGSASISTLAKDLRRRLMGEDPDHPDWALGEDYTVEAVAERMVEMFHDELFVTEYPPGTPAPSPLGLLVAGYSSGEKQAEAWQITIGDAAQPPQPVQTIDIPAYGWIAFAQPEATERLFYGIDPALRDALQSVIDPAVWSGQVLPLLQSSQRQPVIPAMPFGDAISLATFLVETTAQYSHYLLGPDTVGGVVEVAAISRHEGFRWIQRKHYYSPELNPWGHPDA